MVKLKAADRGSQAGRSQRGWHGIGRGLEVGDRNGAEDCRGLVEEGAAAECFEVEEVLEVDVSVGLGGGFIGAAAKGGGLDVELVKLDVKGFDLSQAGEDLIALERGCRFGCWR
jgi:hypothetical protein